MFLVGCRIGEVRRVTKETNVFVNVNLDGSGVSECSTGIPFLDHMLDVSVNGLVLLGYSCFFFSFYFQYFFFYFL